MWFGIRTIPVVRGYPISDRAHGDLVSPIPPGSRPDSSCDGQTWVVVRPRNGRLPWSTSEPRNKFEIGLFGLNHGPKLWRILWHCSFWYSTSFGPDGWHSLGLSDVFRRLELYVQNLNSPFRSTLSMVREERD
jgi:hypothetical protein